MKDMDTGLEWKAGPDTDMNWNEARAWVRGLGEGWRMPTMDELAHLYQEGKGPRNMTPLLETTGWWVWSGEEVGSSNARAFNFGTGIRGWSARDYARYGRAFAVRSIDMKTKIRNAIKTWKEYQGDITDPKLDSAHTDALLDLEATIPGHEMVNNQYITIGSQLDWISDILLEGKEPPDFALSYPLIRRAWELQRFWDEAHKESELEDYPTREKNHDK